MVSKTGPIRQLIGPLKGHVNKNQKKAQELLAIEAPDDKNDLYNHLSALQLCHDILQTHTQKLQAKHDEWFVLVQDSDDQNEHDIYANSSEDVMSLLLDSDELLHALVIKTERLQPDFSGSHSHVETISSPTKSTTNQSIKTSDETPLQAKSPSAFKAPKIKLPTFSGNYMEFRQFWGIFEANIHNRTDLTNIEKFTYLLSQLEGDAKHAIAGVLINDDNYDVAVTLLKSRFDRADERMVTMLYSEFMKIPCCSKKVAEKQRTIDDCERILRQLASAGEDVNSNKSLVFGLLSKFPAGMVRDLQRYYNVSTHNSLNEVRDALQKSIMEEETTTGVIEDLESMRSNRGTQLQKNEQHQHHGGKTNDQQKTEVKGQWKNEDDNRDRQHVFFNSALPAMTNRPRQFPDRRPQLLEPPGECYFCGGEHFNGACPKFTSFKDRRARLQQVNRCQRCLKAHQPGTRCPWPIKCVHCRTHEEHASALCPRNFPENQSRYPNTPTQTNRNASGGNQNAFHQNSGGNQNSPQHNASRNSGNDTSNGNSFTNSGGVTALNSVDVKPALFQTAKTIAVNPVTGQRCTVRLVMDTLSSRSYILESAARKLGLTSDLGGKLAVNVFGTEKMLEVPTFRVKFDVLLGDDTPFRIEANTTRIICQPGAIRNDWSKSENLTLKQFHKSLADDPFDDDGTIDILIGASLVWEFIEGPRFPTSSPRLFLIPSKFGLMLAGEAEASADSNEPWPTLLCLTDSPCQFPSEIGIVASETKFEASYPDIDEFWDLERIGIKDCPYENDDDKALENFQKTVKFENGRYQVTLPWIDEKRCNLPTNYDVAYDRFRNLSKRLKSNNELLHGYREIMQTQKDRGIIEQVPQSEIETSNTTHYLPHHPVVKLSSNTTKIRVVYDAAAKKNKQFPSLNECIRRGPVILPDLCQLLMRLRLHEVLVISDLEKAFLQVGLQKQERDSTRFLWFKDDSNLSLKDNIAVFRFTRVNFGVISSPFLLGATIDHHLTMENTEFAERLRKQIYVDNVVSGLKTEDDPIDYYNNLKALFLRAGMNIQEFCSNSCSFMESIPEKDRVKQTDVKLLGLKWDSQNDDTLRLVSSGKLSNGTTNPTKRIVLRAIASVFDPLGFYQPVVLPAKCFLQRLWDFQYGWDDVLPADLQKEWSIMASNLNNVFEHRIPRFIGNVDDECSFAVFCDASTLAYATTVYLRCKNGNRSWNSNLIFAKSRLSPSAGKRDRAGGRLSLPRLELLGAVIGVRAGNFCREGLQLLNAKIDFFIDSQCVLHWIGSRGLLKRFVANRIDEIRKTKNCEFHYVCTDENPADFSTRGKLPEELLENNLWWKGPTWLNEERSKWPQSLVRKISDNTFREIQNEVKTAYIGHALTVTVKPPETSRLLSIDPSNVSTLTKLVRVSALCLKFLKRKIWNRLSSQTKNLKPGLKRMFSGISDDFAVDTTDFHTAKLQWIKCGQATHFSDIIETLISGNVKRNSPQIIQQLGLHLDENYFLRAVGRFRYSDLPQMTREPLLLSKKDRFSVLLVQHVHNANMHAGVSHTLSQVRMECWIPHGRALVKQVIRRCLICCRYKTAKSYKLPPMPPWPKERVSRAAPFQTTGLDYFGPITVNVNGTRTKMWVCLFTCLAVRAVHLEPVMDCSANEFLHSVIRFISRRGVPSTIISDNAAQFQLVKILGDHAWKRTPTANEISKYSAETGIKWKFITELAPWQGGIYEKLVGIVKTALRTSIRNKLLSWTDFVTLLAEAEAIVNSRPITYIGDDIDSSYRAIRPMDFLVMRRTNLTDSPDGNEVKPKDFGEAGKRVVAIWKQRCRMLEKLWKLWRDDYLLCLRERGIVKHPSGRSDVAETPLLHQVVLVYDPDAPRGRWKLGRITKLFTGNDGQIRSAEFRLGNGTVMCRALNHLIPLEVDRDREIEPNDGTANHDANERNQPTPSNSDEQDDEEFYGFSPDDIHRTVEALRRFDDAGSDADEAIPQTINMTR